MVNCIKLGREAEAFERVVEQGALLARGERPVL